MDGCRKTLAEVRSLRKKTRIYAGLCMPLGSARLGIGGARRDRTADLLNAIQALSQLSYGPDAT